MKLLRVLLVVAAAAIVSWLAYGCSGVTQIDPSQIGEFTTLTVTYGDPGGSPDPCNDVLPQIDGLAEDREWVTAEPIFLRMRSAEGALGSEYYLELRAIWTDETRVGGADRIYFLVRYPDTNNDYKPDHLLYARIDPLTGEMVSSPIADDSETPACDEWLLATEPPDSLRWIRVNEGGREDQILLLLTETQDDDPEPALPPLTRELMAGLGPKAPGGPIAVTALDGPADVWLWRAGRTNMHPVAQFPIWEDIVAGVPDFQYSRFQQTTGFCEDFWVQSGSAAADEGLSPYIANWREGSPVPLRLTECPPTGRDISDEEINARNKGIPTDLGLWYPTTTRFECKSVLACSRLGTPPLWGKGLQEGEFDAVQGWGLRLPTGSARDVRARAAYTVNQDKGFPVRVLEVMRDLNTGNGDDLVINPDGTQLYRMVIGVLNNSAGAGSISTEIRLQFEPRKPRIGTARRC